MKFECQLLLVATENRMELGQIATVRMDLLFETDVSMCMMC